MMSDNRMIDGCLCGQPTPHRHYTVELIVVRVSGRSSALFQHSHSAQPSGKAQASLQYGDPGSIR